MKDYYYILGVKQDATQVQIKEAFRKLSIKFHPDKNDGDSFFEERFKEINEAYGILSNQQKKTVYDNQLRAYSQGRKYESPPPQPPPPPKASPQPPPPKPSTPPPKPKPQTKQADNQQGVFTTLLVVAAIITIILVIIYNNTSQKGFLGNQQATQITYDSQPVQPQQPPIAIDYFPNIQSFEFSNEDKRELIARDVDYSLYQKQINKNIKKNIQAKNNELILVYKILSNIHNKRQQQLDAIPFEEESKILVNIPPVKKRFVIFEFIMLNANPQQTGAEGERAVFSDVIECYGCSEKELHTLQREISENYKIPFDIKLNYKYYWYADFESAYQDKINRFSQIQ